MHWDRLNLSTQRNRAGPFLIILPGHRYTAMTSNSNTTDSISYSSKSIPFRYKIPLRDSYCASRETSNFPLLRETLVSHGYASCHSSQSSPRPGHCPGDTSFNRPMLQYEPPSQRLRSDVKSSEREGSINLPAKAARINQAECLKLMRDKQRELINDARLSSQLAAAAPAGVRPKTPRLDAANSPGGLVTPLALEEDRDYFQHCPGANSPHTTSPKKRSTRRSACYQREIQTADHSGKMD